MNWQPAGETYNVTGSELMSNLEFLEALQVDARRYQSQSPAHGTNSKKPKGSFAAGHTQMWATAGPISVIRLSSIYMQYLSASMHACNCVVCLCKLMYVWLRVEH